MKTVNKPFRIFAVFVLGGLFSCEGFLEKEPLNEVTAENFFLTEADAEAVLIGAYDALHSEYYIFDMFINSDVTSDNCYAGGDNPNNFQIDNLTVTPTNGNVERDWRYLYQGISGANGVLDNVSGMSEEIFTNPERKEGILGEASFLRAFHYFQLVNLWGGVPLILNVVTSADPDANRIPRASVEEVYDQIILDLEFALDRVPRDYGSTGLNSSRVTKGAVNAMLARAHAFRPVPNWEAVRQHAEAVIEDPLYNLLPDFEQLWDEQNENSAESLFEIQFITNPEASWGPQMWLTPSLTGDSWKKFNTPSNDLLAAFASENDLVRLNSSVLMEGDVPWVDEFFPGGDIPFPWKWRTPNGWSSPNNTILLRLAEVILWYAEALNETGNTAGAIAELDKVRGRAGLPGTTASSQTDLRQAIYKERRLELAYEGLRWFDLKRTGRALEVMNSLDHPVTGEALYNVSADDLLWPIPQVEMDRAGLQQNAGY